MTTALQARGLTRFARGQMIGSLGQARTIARISARDREATTHDHYRIGFLPARRKQESKPQPSVSFDRECRQSVTSVRFGPEDQGSRNHSIYRFTLALRVVRVSHHVQAL